LTEPINLSRRFSGRKVELTLGRRPGADSRAVPAVSSVASAIARAQFVGAEVRYVVETK
jgi:hypothetical protein